MLLDRWYSDSWIMEGRARADENAVEEVPLE
jgi:hypothetical protein